MIFTIGYSAQKKPRLPALKLDELAHIREQLGAVIVDVRARPFSRWRPEMNKLALQQRFGDDYHHESTLGNQVRALPGRVDPGGIALLRQHETRKPALGAVTAQCYRPPLLMCTEKAPGDCHRHHAIAMQLEYDSVIHLYHDGEEWTGIEAYELERSLLEDNDYTYFNCGDPFNADALRSIGILPWG